MAAANAETAEPLLPERRSQARGKRRIHQRPTAMEQNACHPWLEAEIEVVRPELIVALGAVAARSLYGSSVKVTRDRGELVESELARYATVTIHPSALLRIEDPEEKRLARAEFARDLAAAWDHLGTGDR